MVVSAGTGAGRASAGPHSSLRWLPFGAAVFAAQLALIHGVVLADSSGESLRYLLPAAHLILVPFLVANRWFWGMRIVLAGLLMNLAAMLANGGLMPVEADAVAAVGRHDVSALEVGSPVPGTKNVLLEANDIRLRALSDRIILPVPRPMTKALSLGDIFVFSGVAVAFAEVVLRQTSQSKRMTPGHLADIR